MVYKGKKLDEFQIQAIDCINKSQNVIVSAPTGTGKTLVADYCIEKCLNEGKRVVYTAPIKALSNQKYREFSKLIGRENVGVLTGDTVINKKAPFLIMTTEIYRNILYSDFNENYDIEFNDDIACVIFDEIHYISDKDRGTVWEEAILMKPKGTFMVGLSATIPNIGDLAGWIESVKDEKVNVVYHKERAVPLSHSIWCNGTMVDLKDHDELKVFANKKNDEGYYLKILNSFSQSDFPMLYFSFNRAGSYTKAMEYAKNREIKSEEKIKAINTIVENILSEYERDSKDINNFNTYLNLFYKGIGVHHAGMLPVIKLMVEELFENRFLDVVFCTETFAIGINFPVKTVCMDGYRKFDGRDFRNLFNKEYFQIGGRAGRRGIDEFGTVITIVKPTDIKFKDYPLWSEYDMELLDSNFKVSYNIAMQMFDNKNNKIEAMLKDNFAIYLMNKQVNIFKESKDYFFNKLSSLKKTCCSELGKNNCPMNYEKTIRVLEDEIKNCVWKRDKDNKIRVLKDIRKRKIKNCTKEQKRICRSKYSEYENCVEMYLKEKNLYEDYCNRYAQDYFLKQYDNRKKMLNELGYIRLDSGETLIRGKVMKDIYIQELLVCELIFSDFFEKYNEDIICGIIAGVDFDGVKVNKEEKIDSAMIDAYMDIYELSQKLMELELNILGEATVLFNDTPCNIAYKIAKGYKIAEIMEETNINDGDIVSIARRTLAILSEVKEAVSDRPFLVKKIKRCISKIDRDEYKALF